MTAEQAKTATTKARQNAVESIGPRIFSSIQDEAAKGRNFLLCRSNKITRQQLKTRGFGVILLGTITLVRW